MARNIIGSLPFTLYTIDTDNEILKTELESMLDKYLPMNRHLTFLQKSLKSFSIPPQPIHRYR